MEFNDQNNFLYNSSFFFYYYDLLYEAANNNNIEILYILLNEKTFKDTSALFIKNYKLKQICIPANITKIGECCFLRCQSLREIFIPSSVTSIENYAFYACISLTKITIPSSVTSIGDFAFKECKSLKKISIPSSIKVIKKSTFSNCFSLKQIIIPSSVKTIEEDAFYDCKSLAYVFFEFPSILTSIGDSSFCGCSSLIQISIPPSVKLFDEYAFSECSQLRKLTIPSSVRSIRSGAFSKCYSLTQITFENPSSVKYIGSCAFESCRSLDKISFPSSVKSTGYNVFIGCKKHVDISKYPKRKYDNFFETDGFLYLLYLLTMLFYICEYWIIYNWFIMFCPWILHGHKSGKSLYQLLNTTKLLAFFVCTGEFIYIIFNHVFKFKILYFLGIIVFFASLLIENICGFCASYYAIRDDRINGKSIKCLKYVLDIYEGAKLWADNQSSNIQKNLKFWHLDMVKKAYDNNGNATNYYCKKIGIPLLIFSSLTLISGSFFFIIFKKHHFQIVQNNVKIRRF